MNLRKDLFNQIKKEKYTTQQMKTKYLKELSNQGIPIDPMQLIPAKQYCETLDEWKNGVSQLKRQKMNLQFLMPSPQNNQGNNSEAFRIYRPHQEETTIAGGKMTIKKSVESQLMDHLEYPELNQNLLNTIVNDIDEEDLLQLNVSSKMNSINQSINTFGAPVPLNTNISQSCLNKSQGSQRSILIKKQSKKDSNSDQKHQEREFEENSKNFIRAVELNTETAEEKQLKVNKKLLNDLFFSKITENVLRKDPSQTQLANSIDEAYEMIQNQTTDFNIQTLASFKSLNKNYRNPIEFIEKKEIAQKLMQDKQDKRKLRILQFDMGGLEGHDNDEQNKAKKSDQNQQSNNDEEKENNQENPKSKKSEDTYVNIDRNMFFDANEARLLQQYKLFEEELQKDKKIIQTFTKSLHEISQRQSDIEPELQKLQDQYNNEFNALTNQFNQNPTNSQLQPPIFSNSFNVSTPELSYLKNPFSQNLASNRRNNLNNTEKTLEFQKQELLMTQYSNARNVLLTKYSANKVDYETTNNRILGIKKHMDEKQVRRKLIQYQLRSLYVQLLSNEKYVLANGCARLVQALWRVGEEVTTAIFPSWMDTDSIKFALQLYGYEILIDSIAESIITTTGMETHNSNAIDEYLQNLDELGQPESKIQKESVNTALQSIIDLTQIRKPIFTNDPILELNYKANQSSGGQNDKNGNNSTNQKSLQPPHLLQWVLENRLNQKSTIDLMFFNDLGLKFNRNILLDHREKETEMDRLKLEINQLKQKNFDRLFVIYSQQQDEQQLQNMEKIFFTLFGRAEGTKNIVEFKRRKEELRQKFEQNSTFTFAHVFKEKKGHGAESNAINFLLEKQAAAESSELREKQLIESAALAGTPISEQYLKKLKNGKNENKDENQNLNQKLRTEISDGAAEILAAQQYRKDYSSKDKFDVAAAMLKRSKDKQKKSFSTTTFLTGRIPQKNVISQEVKQQYTEFKKTVIDKDPNLFEEINFKDIELLTYNQAFEFKSNDQRAGTAVSSSGGLTTPQTGFRHQFSVFSLHDNNEGSMGSQGMISPLTSQRSLRKTFLSNSTNISIDNKAISQFPTVAANADQNYQINLISTSASEGGIQKYNNIIMNKLKINNNEMFPESQLFSSTLFDNQSKIQINTPSKIVFNDGGDSESTTSKMGTHRPNSLADLYSGYGNTGNYLQI